MEGEGYTPAPQKQYHDRVRINVGGTIFETYISTLTKYPHTLLGAMFSDSLLKPDSNNEYFFDRSPLAFEAIMNFYRTGKLRAGISGLSKQILEEEIDYWQLPRDCLQDEERLGNRLGCVALEAVRKKAEPLLTKIKNYIIENIENAALEGVQSFSIEFKESQGEYYAFLSNFSNRELLLHDLLQENFDVSFNDMTSGQGHSYILFITLWNRYTRQKYGESATTALSKILEELRQGVEVKTAKDDHILTVKPIFL